MRVRPDPEDLAEGLEAAGGEADQAGARLAGRPAQAIKPIQQGEAPRAPARWLRRTLQSRQPLQSGRRDIASAGRSRPSAVMKVSPAGVEAKRLGLLDNEAAGDHVIEHVHRQITGEVVIADRARGAAPGSLGPVRTRVWPVRAARPISASSTPATSSPESA